MVQFSLLVGEATLDDKDFYGVREAAKKEGVQVSYKTLYNIIKSEEKLPESEKSLRVKPKSRGKGILVYMPDVMRIVPKKRKKRSDVVEVSRDFNSSLLNINVFTKKFPEFLYMASVKKKPYKKSETWEWDRVNDAIYKKHTSYIYLVVARYEIVKLGESEKPLAIFNKKSTSTTTLFRTGSVSRIGRLGSHSDKNETDSTDEGIRNTLLTEASNGDVQIFAWAIPILGHTDSRFEDNASGGKVSFTGHKDLEKQLLEVMCRDVGKLPRCNKGKA
jgi:hypothetical protein